MIDLQPATAAGEAGADARRAGAPPPGVRAVDAVVLREGVAAPVREWVAEEVPVALVYNGISHAVMLASPVDLEDFAFGFSFTEGLVQAASQVLDVEVGEATPAGIEVQVQVTGAAFAGLKERRRTLAGRTGCGLCGVESLAQVGCAATVPPREAVAGAAVARAMAELGERQTLQRATGATHAAAWCALDGRVLLVREDVGRHNALDKLVGAMLRARLSAADGFVAITSRASHEMVAKTAALGAGTLAAISAPTTLAIDTARGAGVALIGFARGQRAVLYTRSGT